MDQTFNHDPRHFSSFHQQSAFGVPAGLEPLAALNSVVIEFAGALDLESFIKNPSEELLYVSHNDFECCDCSGESRREFLINDQFGRPVMQFIRTFDNCCRSKWASETMVVQAPAGSEIGRINIDPGFFSSTCTITDAAGQQIASFEREFKLFGFSYIFTAPIAGGMELQLGRMECEYSCASIIMNVTFDNVTDYRLKVLMIASAYLITMMRRERRNN